jgi:hypothetical protein
MTRHTKEWNDKDEATLQRLWSDPSIPRCRVGSILRRTGQSCSSRARALGLGPKATPTRRLEYWTEERLEFLRTKYMVDQWPASKIAEALGGGVTRSACCGMLSRKGWVRPDGFQTVDAGLADRLVRVRKERAARSPKAKPPRPAEKRDTIAEKERAFRAVERAANAVAMKRVWEPLEGVEPLPFPLRRGHCNWPLDLPGEAPGVYRCGALSEGQYCAHHGAIAFRPKRAKSQPIYRAGR